jgi:hypothetical protein
MADGRRTTVRRGAGLTRRARPRVHAHRWKTTFDNGELVQQSCRCGADRDLAFDYQDGSTTTTVYSRGRDP